MPAGGTRIHMRIFYFHEKRVLQPGRASERGWKSRQKEALMHSLALNGGSITQQINKINDTKQDAKRQAAREKSFLHNFARFTPRLIYDCHFSINFLRGEIKRIAGRRELFIA
jgi:hypothetical protein